MLTNTFATGTNPALTAHLTLCVGRALLKPADKAMFGKGFTWHRFAAVCAGLPAVPSGVSDRDQLCWPLLGEKELLVFTESSHCFPRRTGALRFYGVIPLPLPGEKELSIFTESSHPTRGFSLPPCLGKFPPPNLLMAM